MADKILYLIAQDHFRDEEYLVPRAMFESAGYGVTVAAPELRECLGIVKTRVLPDLAIGQADPKDYRAVVIAGGGGSKKYLWNNPDVLRLIQGAHRSGKAVGAICLSAALPAQAGLLKGKRGTVWPEPSAIRELEKNGVVYTESPVVVSDRIVTSPGPDHSRIFGQALLDLLTENTSNGKDRRAT
ncbi:MAG TPA: DJ-1/PfpI family protein [Elusimicrobiota bacterium]|nr:DJ-1/PfpI family protein [Elusimicrobiota bacterium]